MTNLYFSAMFDETEVIDKPISQAENIELKSDARLARNNAMSYSYAISSGIRPKIKDKIMFKPKSDDWYKGRKN